MDFESINLRMKRLYVSIGSIVVKDYLDDCNVTEDTNGTLHFNFGSNDEQENEAKIFYVIGNIADLKDNLKKRMAVLNKNKKLVEAEIDKSIALRLLTDLDNQHKHGIPLDRARYDKGPINVTNIRVGVKIYNRPATVMKESKPQEFSGGYVTTFGGDNSETVIDADIVDKDQNFICYLDDIVNDSIKIWSKFIDEHKL